MSNGLFPDLAGARDGGHQAKVVGAGHLEARWSDVAVR
jgi:hypothetical protein